MDGHQQRLSPSGGNHITDQLQNYHHQTKEEFKSLSTANYKHFAEMKNTMDINLLCALAVMFTRKQRTTSSDVVFPHANALGTNGVKRSWSIFQNHTPLLTSNTQSATGSSIA
jgi:hypothetical protein